jgi:hypothetical protein
MGPTVKEMLAYYFNSPLQYFLSTKLLIDKVMDVESVGFDIPSFTKNVFILNTLMEKVTDAKHGHNGIRVRNLVMHGNVCYYQYINLYLQQNHFFKSCVCVKSYVFFSKI